MSLLVDTHAHLDFAQFDPDRPDVLERAWQAGLGAIITIGIDEVTSRRAVALAQSHPRLFATIGFHPHEAAKADDRALERLRALAGQAKVVALGEIGLDYHYDHPPREQQQTVFRRQVRLAREFGLPIAVHSREANQEVLAILREEGAAEVGGVMHCFSGDVSTAEAFIELGFYISLAGPVTFQNATTPKFVARRVPLDRLLVETDCPFLSPHPYRGQRNEPARVTLVVDEIARQRSIKPEEVARHTGANARRLFRLDAGQR